jgi:putative tricarboxylic transport membrane protein
VAQTVRPAAAQRIGEVVFAALALGLGLFVLIGAGAIRVPGAGSTVGPRVFPYLVSIILIASAAMVLVDLLRGRLGPQEESEDADPTAKTDWITLAKLAAFVVAHIALIPLLGWPIAAAILFGGVAWSLGAKKWWVALLVGFALSLTVQVVFGGLLGLSLPLGPLLGFLEPLFTLLRG